MKYLVLLWDNGAATIIGQYNNYDVESGHMERSIIQHLKEIFPESRIKRDSAGMAEKVGDKDIQIIPFR